MDSRTHVRFDTAVAPADPLRQLTGEALLLEYQASGDRGLFAELIYRFGPGLYSYLCGYLGDTEIAEEVFQKTFLHVHGRRAEFEKGAPLRPWLYEIATNQAAAAQESTRPR